MSNDNKIQFVTPVGRLVAGDLWTPKTTDFHGNPLLDNDNNPISEYFIALAIPKNHPEWPALHALFIQAARTGFPTMIDQNGKAGRPDFAWKITDGDSDVMNRKNVRPCDKEGYKGHWVLSMSTRFPIGAVDQQRVTIMPETKAIKRGDYIRVAGATAPNGNANNPGIYINPSIVQFSHQGDEIVSGPNAEELFGAIPLAPAPAGANTIPTPSLQPIAPTPTAPTTPVAPQPSAPAPAPVANVAPAPDFLNPAPAAPAPAPVVEQFSYQGGVYTRDALRASGWTDDVINSLPRA
jgi:hypothetical protein